MINRYIIEIYDPYIRRYVKSYESSSIEWAEKVINKPYYRNATRRLVKISTEILYTEKRNAKRKETTYTQTKET